MNSSPKNANSVANHHGNRGDNDDAMYTDLALYIDGKWVNGGGRKGEDVLNPATEKPLAHLPHAGKADLDEALEAAKRGFALWREPRPMTGRRSFARPPTSCA